jgi:hypothetical protein
MPAIPNVTTITLNEKEVAGALQKAGGGQTADRAQDFVRKQLETGTNKVELKDVHLGILIRLMCQGSGAVQAVLRRDFQRPLTELITKD